MRLSDFKDEKAIEVVSKLLLPIGKIAQNPEMREAANGKTQLEFAAALLNKNAAEVKAMLAILSDKEPEEYHCNAATVLLDVFQMISDPALLELFGLQSQTPASSGSASANTEAPETSDASSDTARQG